MENQDLKSQNIVPQFWYEWGNEKPGHVSTGAYDTNDKLINTGYMLKKQAEKLGLTFNNPHS